VDSLRALTTRFPDFAPAKIWLAYYLTFTAYPAPSGPEADEALKVAQQAVQQAPEMSGTHAALGHVLERLGRHEEALRHLHQATTLSPHNEPAYVLKAEIFIREGKVAPARAALDSAIMVTPNVGRQVDHRENRAVALLYEGNVKQMMDELAANARAAEANGQLPAAAAVHMTMAVTSAGARDATTALVHHAEAKRLNLAAGTLADGEVVMFFLLGRAEDARRALGDYVRLAAGQAANAREQNIHRMTGLTLVAEGKPEEAIAELKQGGANPYAQLGIIEAYLLQRKTREAEAERAAMLARKDTPYTSTAVPIARYRGTNR
jgi:tetratricopeptide (TPR) repeat protein